jgi:thioredoxin reductase (NADPH)
VWRSWACVRCLFCVSNDGLGRSVELARHGPGQFAGELSLLTGQRPFLTARAATGGTVLALTPA